MLKDKIMILGEGITEFYYIESLKDEFKDVNLYPSTPKNSNYKELEAKIKSGMETHKYIFCIIDMDTKCSQKEKEKYDNFKKKYQKHWNKPKKGIDCHVHFFETHRCTELFFLYYFKYTSKEYFDQSELIRELNSFCDYEKKEKFFIKHPLHGHFIKKGGKLEDAIKNSTKSADCINNGERDYTYSQLGEMLKKIQNLKK